MDKKSEEIRSQFYEFLNRPTIDEISKAIGIASPTLCRFRLGKLDISKKNIEKIAKYLANKKGNTNG